MPKLIIKNKAELKIRIALQYMKDIEVSWFGQIYVDSNGNYVLKDVFFPPQENNPAHVTTKDDEYPKWFFNNFTKTGIAKQIRLHGHTHPRMKPNPSGIDIDQFTKLMDQVDDYMIQLIMRNIDDCNAWIWSPENKAYPMEIVFDYKKKFDKVLEKVTNKDTHQIRFKGLYELNKTC